MALTRPASRGENLYVRVVGALLITAILAAQPICVFAASWATPKPDPVGEKVYSSGLLERMAPIAIVAGGLSLAWVVDRVRRKAKKLIPDNAGSHHG